MKNVKFIALDMDGVLKVGMNAIKGADETVLELQKRGYQLMIVTNECRWTVSELSQRLSNIGLPISAKLPIYTAALAVRDYLSQRPRRNISVIGGKGLSSTLMDSSEVKEGADDGAKYLVIGTMANEELTEAHIDDANEQIAKGANIVLTCADRIDPSRYPIQMPLDILDMCNRNTSSVSAIGKPHPIVIQAMMKHFNTIIPQTILFVGDTMDTDIKIAHHSGFQSALVLSGNTNIEDLPKYSFGPDYVIDSIVNLLDLL